MWPNPEETADLVTFTEEILNGKLHFLYSVSKPISHSCFPLFSCFLIICNNCNCNKDWNKVEHNTQKLHFPLTICLIKANHLVYIVPRWYGSRVDADCQQMLFSLEHDTGGRILLVTFLAEQKRKYEAQR